MFVLLFVVCCLFIICCCLLFVVVCCLFIGVFVVDFWFDCSTAQFQTLTFPFFFLLAASTRLSLKCTRRRSRLLTKRE